MLFVESEKVYALKKRHGSDTIVLCVKRALSACKQGDGIFCKSLVEVTLTKRVAKQKGIVITMRKQDKGGWIIYPLFYKSPAYKHLYVKNQTTGNNPADSQQNSGEKTT